MTRAGLAVLLLASVPGAAADPAGEDPGFAERVPEPAPIVDEDEEFAQPERQYAFNPVQARNEFKVGIFYSKKGSHRAAAKRYLEATRWDPGLAEAFRRLGMAREKLSEHGEAANAYRRFLEIEADGKAAREVRRRLARAEREAARGSPPLAGNAGSRQRPPTRD